MNQENASLLVPNGSYVDPMEDILISPAGNSIVSITLEQRRVKSLGDFYPGHGIVNHSSPVLQNTSPVIKLRLFCKFSLFLAWTMLEEHCQFFFFLLSYTFCDSNYPFMPTHYNMIRLLLTGYLLHPCPASLRPRSPCVELGVMQILWSHTYRFRIIYSFKILNIVCGFY